MKELHPHCPIRKLRRSFYSLGDRNVETALCQSGKKEIGKTLHLLKMEEEGYKTCFNCLIQTITPSLLMEKDGSLRASQ